MTTLFWHNWIHKTCIIGICCTRWLSRLESFCCCSACAVYMMCLIIYGLVKNHAQWHRALHLRTVWQGGYDIRSKGRWARGMCAVGRKTRRESRQNFVIFFRNWHDALVHFYTTTASELLMMHGAGSMIWKGGSEGRKSPSGVQEQGKPGSK